MERTIFLLFLCTPVEGGVGKHIFVPIDMTWLGAQSFCRQHYTDLSSVSSESDACSLLTAGDANNLTAWIGLRRDPSNTTQWKWSGGGHVTYQNWHEGQPDNNKNEEEFGQVWDQGTWNDGKETTPLPFYCISVVLVVQEMTWEEALEYCREHHTDLASLHSETDTLLAQTGLKKGNTIERVWIGLRYLGDRWLWVSESLPSQTPQRVYETWSQGDQDHQCPMRKRCGAFTRDGLWENRDCQDKLKFICQ